MHIDTLHLARSGFVPNHPDVPVLIYSQCTQCADSTYFQEIFARNGWTGIWRNGVFDYHHYHTTAHEVLGIGKGEAKLQIGGPDGPILDVRKGDCLLLPAGTGHKKLESSDDFQVVGAYPTNCGVDIQRKAPTERMLATIRALPIPKSDPVLGSAGGLLEFWQIG